MQAVSVQVAICVYVCVCVKIYKNIKTTSVYTMNDSWEWHQPLEASALQSIALFQPWSIQRRVTCLAACVKFVLWL